MMLPGSFDTSSFRVYSLVVPEYEFNALRSRGRTEYICQRRLITPSSEEICDGDMAYFVNQLTGERFATTVLVSSFVPPALDNGGWVSLSLLNAKNYHILNVNIQEFEHIYIFLVNTHSAPNPARSSPRVTSSSSWTRTRKGRSHLRLIVFHVIRMMSRR